MGCVNVTYDETYQYEPGEGRPECLAACPVGSFNFTDLTPTSGLDMEGKRPAPFSKWLLRIISHPFRVI